MMREVSGHHPMGERADVKAMMISRKKIDLYEVIRVIHKDWVECCLSSNI